MFFFEKKNQKIFIRLGPSRAGGLRKPPMNKSLFASFSSEKEVLASLYVDFDIRGPG
jgi:hypothetical protein